VSESTFIAHYCQVKLTATQTCCYVEKVSSLLSDEARIADSSNGDGAVADQHRVFELLRLWE
jgi:hypothetical protein